MRSNSSFETPSNRDGAESKPIQIKVIHERTPQQVPTPPKNRVSSGRNTTEIPAPVTNIQADKSPRLERAHSEPPKSFNQRLRSGGASSPASHGYSTIPENAEPVTLAARSPRFETDSNSHKLSSSASAPSVPNTNLSRQNQSPGAPVAPPRRSSANQTMKQDSEEERPIPHFTNSTEGEPRVRHIPIFVEGRDEPVLQKKISQPEGTPSSTPFKQPSEFYPPSISKIRGQNSTSPTPSFSGRPQGPNLSRNLNLKPSQPHVPPKEPTSPLSPPPSNQPIPMGCSENFVRQECNPSLVKEPSSPILPPPGPIPMPFTSDIPDGPEKIHSVPIQLEEKSGDPENLPSKNSTKPSPAEEKLKKIQQEVSELLERVEKFSGSKKDKEYLFLDDLLTQKMCILDGIESEGQDDIRKMRKDSIKAINRCLSLLDKRALSALSEKEIIEADGAKVITQTQF